MELGIFSIIFLIIFGSLITIVVFLRPTLGFYLLVLILPIENVVLLPGGMTWARVILIFVLFAWITRKIILNESWNAMLTNNILTKALFFIGLAFISFLWAESPEQTIRNLVTPIALLILALIMIDVGSSWDRIEKTPLFLVMGGLIACIITILQYFFYDFIRAGVDVAGGINKTSAVLVILLPFAFFIFRYLKNFQLLRLVGLLYIIISPIAVAVSLSRIGMLTLPFVFLAQFYTNVKKGLHQILGIILVSVLIVTFSIRFIPWEQIENRLQTLSTLIDNPGEDIQSSRYDSGRARIFIWKCAFEIFKDHALLGVGYMNFGFHYTHYQFLIPGIVKIKISKNMSPHSTLFGIIAEFGIIGLILWSLLNYTVLKNIRVGLLSNNSEGGESRKMLIRTIQQVFIIYTLYSVVSITHNHKIFWLVIGMSGALMRLYDPSANKGELKKLDS